jgi:hypothetical protein
VERAAALRTAFLATSRDPAYLADAAALKIPIEPVSGEEIDRAIARLSTAPPQLLDRVRRLMIPKKGN